MVGGHDLAPENPVELRVGQVHAVVPIERLAGVERRQDLLHRRLAEELVEPEHVERELVALVEVDDEPSEQGRVGLENPYRRISVLAPVLRCVHNLGGRHEKPLVLAVEAHEAEHPVALPEVPSVRPVPGPVRAPLGQAGRSFVLRTVEPSVDERLLGLSVVHVQLDLAVLNPLFREVEDAVQRDVHGTPARIAAIY